MARGLKNLSEPVWTLKDAGKGRALVILREGNASSDRDGDLFESLRARGRCLLMHSPAVNEENWPWLTESLLDRIKETQLKQVSILAFEAAGSLAQNLCLREPRLVRSMMLVDPSAQPHRGWLGRLVDLLESQLPMGLPFRQKGEGFDGRAFFQRMRCPVLVVSSPDSSSAGESEARSMAGKMPTAWHVRLSREGGLSSLPDALLAFMDIPARCPQKTKL